MQKISKRPRSSSLCIFCTLQSATASSLSTSDHLSRLFNTSRRARKFESDDKNKNQSALGSLDSPTRLRDGIHETRNKSFGADERGSKFTRLGPRDQFKKSKSSGGFDRKEGPSWFRKKGTPQDCNDLIIKMMKQISLRLSQDPILARLKLEPEELHVKWNDYMTYVRQDLKRNENPSRRPFNDSTADDTIKRIQDAVGSNPQLAELYLTSNFVSEYLMAKFTPSELRQVGKVANLQYPHEWFPATRAFKREFHMHVGPTNSGKTYHALKRLEQAKRGVYAGPLRLLAHEVYMRLNASGKRCNLVTGDERKTADENPEADMTACTVEMVPLNEKYDVAVIDEIQMIGTADRGWAWTQAVLGIQAREIHLCGEERAVPIMREIAALCGDELKVHKYERLSPLKMMPNSLNGNVRLLRKGDCVVCFSIMAIHALRQTIEKQLDCKVAIIYGSLPPETRAQQARLFNDPNNDYDILVASDAVGMGLNLSIKRIIFQTAYKFLKGKFVSLPVHEAKQIAGRAGRYSTAEQDIKKSASSAPVNGLAVADGLDDHGDLPSSPSKQKNGQIGLVTTFERYDYPVIDRCMKSEPTPITSAGLFPPTYIMIHFSRYFPHSTPFSFLLRRVHELAATNSRFHLCELKQQCAIADCIEMVQNLSIRDKLIIVSSPCEPRKEGEGALIKSYAEAIASSKATTLLDFPLLDLELLETNRKKDRQHLRKLESLHKGLTIWMWLSYRYERIFQERELAMHVKERVEKSIEETIKELSFDFSKIRKSTEHAIKDMLSKGEGGFDNEGFREDCVEGKPLRDGAVRPGPVVRERLILAEDQHLNGHELLAGVDGKDKCDLKQARAP